MASPRFQCLRCGQTIDRKDKAAVQIGVENLWKPRAGQGLYAHAACALLIFAGEAPFDPEVLRG